MLGRHRLPATLILVVPLIAAACGGSEDECGDSDHFTAPRAGARAGRGGSGGQASQGGSSGRTDISVGGGPACARAVDAQYAVVEPLGDACSRLACPASVADAAEAALRGCNNTFPPRVTIGCGTITVDASDFSGGTAYTFDAATMKVIGVRTFSDTPFGECNAHEYRYGDFGPDCPEATTCDPCAEHVPGAAGAAGAPDSDACPPF